MPPKWICNHDPVLTMNWGRDEKKKARENTIIKTYRSKYEQSVPHNRQYWTLCGLCATNGKLVPGCEFDHMTSIGLITPDQFYGVEIKKSIHKQNKRIKGPHWFHNDFSQEITNYNIQGNFKPAIVNFDMIRYPNNCVEDFGAIMLKIARLDHPVMLVGNFVLKAWTHKMVDPDFIIDELNNVAQVENALSIANWEYDQQCYRYPGVDGSGRSVLGTIVLHKK